MLFLGVSKCAIYKHRFLWLCLLTFLVGTGLLLTSTTKPKTCSEKVSNRGTRFLCSVFVIIRFSLLFLYCSDVKNFSYIKLDLL